VPVPAEVDAEAVSSVEAWCWKEDVTPVEYRSRPEALSRVPDAVSRVVSFDAKLSQAGDLLASTVILVRCKATGSPRQPFS